MNRNVKITIMVVARVLMAVFALIDFFNCFDTLKLLNYVGSDWQGIIMLLFLTDFICSIVIMIIVIMGITKLVKNRDLDPRTETSFLVVASLMMLMIGLIALMIINKYHADPTTQTIMMIVLGITGIVTGLVAKTSINKNSMVVKIAGTIAGVCVFILCVLALSQDGTGVNNSSKGIYVIFMLAAILSVVYLYIYDMGYALSDPNKGPTDSTSYSKEHLPPTGHAYTPEEYYEKTGIKVNNHDKEE